jgi:hypothetical protein
MDFPGTIISASTCSTRTRRHQERAHTDSAILSPMAMVRICRSSNWWRGEPPRDNALAPRSSGLRWRCPISAKCESGRGGMSHACELETSVYLYLDRERVQMDHARKERAYRSRFHLAGSTDPGPIRMMDYWTASQSRGSTATQLWRRRKGKIIFESVARTSSSSHGNSRIAHAAADRQPLARQFCPRACFQCVQKPPESGRGCRPPYA